MILCGRTLSELTDVLCSSQEPPSTLQSTTTVVSQHYACYRTPDYSSGVEVIVILSQNLILDVRCNAPKVRCPRTN